LVTDVSRGTQAYHVGLEGVGDRHVSGEDVYVLGSPVGT
jgi:hypothetical protein